MINQIPTQVGVIFLINGTAWERETEDGLYLGMGLSEHYTLEELTIEAEKFGVTILHNPTPNVIPEGAVEEFFFTTHHPYKWTSGPTVHTLNTDAGYIPFTSLEQVKAAAEKATVVSSNDSHCVTTYGVSYIYKK